MHFIMIWGLPLITYAPRGPGKEGVKSPIHFHCIIHRKGGRESM